MIQYLVTKGGEARTVFSEYSDAFAYAKRIKGTIVEQDVDCDGNCDYYKTAEKMRSEERAYSFNKA